jgi:hypothetical protein
MKERNIVINSLQSRQVENSELVTMANYGGEEYMGLGFSSTPVVELLATAGTPPQHQAPASLQFVLASQVPSSADSNNVAVTDTTTTPTQDSSASLQLLEAEAQSARLRAMGILRKFQKQHSNHQHNNSVTSSYSCGGNGYHDPTITKTATATSSWDTEAATRELLKRKRLDCLEALKRREHQALLKNLEFLSKVEEERLQQRWEQIEQAKAYEAQVNEQYYSRYQRSGGGKNNNKNSNTISLTSQAGIGTDRQRRIEVNNQRQKRPFNATDTITNSVAIYVAHLPPLADETLLRSLFSLSDGTSIRKVHFYIDKTTGKPKGDALVIYSVSDQENSSTCSPESLVESVCSQLNGCELPGSDCPLLVQPSDPLYKLKRQKTTTTINDEEGTTMTANTEKEYDSQYGPSLSLSDNNNIFAEVRNSTTTKASSSLSTSKDNKDIDTDDDNLDDFFASLEE